MTHHSGPSYVRSQGRSESHGNLRFVSLDESTRKRPRPWVVVIVAASEEEATSPRWEKTLPRLHSKNSGESQQWEWENVPKYFKMPFTLERNDLLS